MIWEDGKRRLDAEALVRNAQEFQGPSGCLPRKECLQDNNPSYFVEVLQKEEFRFWKTEKLIDLLENVCRILGSMANVLSPERRVLEIGVNNIREEILLRLDQLLAQVKGLMNYSFQEDFTFNEEEEEV